jgi:tRNA G46 methylase TrmB
VAAPSDNSTAKNSENSPLPIGEGIIVDIGTGGGRFVYKRAKENPHRFYIAIDANPKALENFPVVKT